MCYPTGVSLVSRTDLVLVQGRWFVSRVPVQGANEEVGGEAAGGDGGSGGGLIKQCVCSPTTHPGSFRCRHHQAQCECDGSENSSALEGRSFNNNIGNGPQA
ncbi:hypothetical protein AB3S75_016822 [Citrus x aurantiifolia]